MSSIERMFGFEASAVRLGKKFFRPLKDAAHRWEAGYPAEHRMCGHHFDVLYELNDGRFVYVQYAICFLERDQQSSADLWLGESVAEARQVDEREALAFLLNIEAEIPESLEDALEHMELDEEDQEEEELPPRSLEYWDNSELLERETDYRVGNDNPLEIAQRVVHSSIQTIQLLRRRTLAGQEQTVGVVTMLEADLFRKFRIKPEEWWGDSQCVPPEDVPLTDLPWPAGCDHIRTLLRQMQDMLRAPLSVVSAYSRITFSRDNDRPTLAEYELGRDALFDRAGELEILTIRLRDAVAAVRESAEEEKQVKIKAKRPSDVALMAFRVRMLTGKIQQEIADLLSEELGRSVDQGQVSRWIRASEEYLEATGILPALPEKLSKRIQSVDPAIIDQGARQDGRTPRQRPRRKS